jgi:DNA-binding IclR family transcriptional regulator
MPRELTVDEGAGDVVQSLAKGLNILSVFTARQPNLSAGEIIRLTGYPRATTYRLLHTLESKRYLAFDPGTGSYHLGPAIASALRSIMESSYLVSVLHPCVEATAYRLGEEVSLATEVHGSQLVIDSVFPDSDLLQSPAEPRKTAGNATSTSHGKLFLAFKPREKWHEVLAQRLPKRTQQTIVDPKRLEAELQAVVRAGVAFDDQEHCAGLCATSAPVWDSTGSLVAAVTIVTSAEGFSEERRRFLADAAKASATEMSSILGRTRSADPAEPFETARDYAVG